MDGMISAGLILIRDGSACIVKPSNGFGGHEWTFPKGKIEQNETLEDAAVRETEEETGYLGIITATLGDYPGDTTVTRFYTGDVIGGDLTAHGNETEEVMWVLIPNLPKYLTKSRDLRIADDLNQVFHGVFD